MQDAVVYKKISIKFFHLSVCQKNSFRTKKEFTYLYVEIFLSCSKKRMRIIVGVLENLKFTQAKLIF